MAIDGKTLRGSRRLEARAVHVLSAFATELGAGIGEMVVKPGQNETLWSHSVIRRRGLSIPAARGNFREDRADAIKVVTGQVL